MGIKNSIVKFFIEPRLHEIQRFMANPYEVQHLVFVELISKAAKTEWGRKYDYASIDSIKKYQERVPVSTYEELFPYFERILKGENNLLWNTKIDWFAKSSGTTNSRSKFVPVSREAIADCHHKAGKDMLAMIFENYPETKVFDGKTLAIGGSHTPNPQAEGTNIGDVSAIIVENLPLWAEYSRAPNREVFMLSKWEEKIDKMIQSTVDENITSLSGVPTWMVVLLNKVLEHTQKNNIKEVWPNLEIFLHGAVSFVPYKGVFSQLCPGMNYIELYNASEGFFGVQDDKNRDDMLLMLDHGVFYEFIPSDDFDKKHPKTITLDKVQLHKNYALVISTNAGLWRYKVGDTIKFTSLKPFRIKISGRTKHFINAFGEELVIENADFAIATACQQTNAVISDYTAAPIYLQNKSKGGHQWLIEFDVMPTDINQFTQILDQTLRNINSDYDAKRYQDMALLGPKISVLPQNTFYKWLKSEGKLGGQHKIPRLSNDRNFVDKLLNEFVQ